jgi:hypothetical protein
MKEIKRKSASYFLILTHNYTPANKNAARLGILMDSAHFLAQYPFLIGGRYINSVPAFPS